MIRIEVIPYQRLDERHDIMMKLDKDKRQKKIKNSRDLGNCFFVEHFEANKNIRV